MSSEQAKLFHSVTFGSKNTWDDWHLVPSSRPVINPPAQKTKTLDIPGADGLIDLSTSLTGYPVYQNRTGSIEFLVMNDYNPWGATYDAWNETYSDISDYLHGQTMRMILDDDDKYYYEGRFAVNSWKSDSNWSKITIDYDVGPYKWGKITAKEWSNYLYDSSWDPILDSSSKNIVPTTYLGPDIFHGISVGATAQTITLDASYLGRAPVCPMFTVTTRPVTVVFTNTTLGISETLTLPVGTTTATDCIFYGDSGATLELYTASGAATVSLNFRLGRL